jgi:hypothetical protein
MMVGGCDEVANEGSEMKTRILFSIMLLAVGVTAAQEEEYVQYVPAIASAKGAGDSFFVTDVRIFNPHPVETITVQLAFLKHNANNLGVDEIAIDIGPRQGGGARRRGGERVRLERRRGAPTAVRLALRRDLPDIQRGWRRGDLRAVHSCAIAG